MIHRPTEVYRPTTQRRKCRKFCPKHSIFAGDRIFVALNANAVVYHEDASATQTADWTQWIIDLQRFSDQGVNLTNVNTITIGIDTKNAPSPSVGTGTTYFDDIRLYR